MTSSTSFITQCPQCVTKFKVTHEQLNVSEGWVRCGRCNHIFDAKGHLLDAQDSAPQTATSPAADTPVYAATETDRANKQAATEPRPEATAASTTPVAAALAEPPAEDLATPRPSERWLKELSDTFSPTAPSATDTASVLLGTASPAVATPAMEPEHAQSNADADAAALDAAEESQWVATEPAALFTEPAPLPATTAAPIVAAEATESPDKTAEEESAAPDNDIASFHDELAQWKSKQDNALATEPTPDTHAAASNAASAFTDGSASPALIQASAAALPPATETAATVTVSPAAKAPEPQQPEAVPIASPAPATKAKHTDREEEQLERYRAEFSETQELRFMREAEQKAFWRRPVLRAFMAVLALLLTGLLAGQWAYVQRDSLAALSPSWKARMQQACTWLGCRITPLQSIEDLVLDGSTFQHAGGNRYTVSWAVRNRSKYWIETPALSLSLRNEAGDTLVRRAIDSGDIKAAPSELAPASTWKVEQHLVLDDYADAITGYQLQIFYPDVVP